MKRTYKFLFILSAMTASTMLNAILVNANSIQDPYVKNQIFENENIEQRNKQSGIVSVNGKLFYYDVNTGELKTTAGWINYNGKQYFAMDGGQLYQNQLINFGIATTYHMGTDGSVSKGIVSLNNRLYYFDEATGVMKKDAGWIDYKGKRYFAMNGGQIYQSQLINFGAATSYYMSGDGSMATGILNINGGTYYFDQTTGMMKKTGGIFEYKGNKYITQNDGKVLKNGKYIVDGKIYQVDANGYVKVGIQTINNRLYYFDEETGTMKVNAGWIDYKGKRYFAMDGGQIYQSQLINFGAATSYYMSGDGSMATGILNINGGTYYFDQTTGMMKKTGGIFEYKGNKYITQNDGKVLKNGKYIVDGKTYQVDANGYVKVGIQTINNRLYYFDEETGAMKVNAGWIDYKGKRYFAMNGGQIYQSQLINFGAATSYYMSGDGSMATGILNINGGAYYFDQTTGMMKKTGGIFEYKGNKYITQSDGKILKNGKYIVDGKTYQVDANGYVKVGIQTINNRLYYFDEETGVMKVNAGWIDYKGKRYFAMDGGQIYQSQLINFGAATSYYMSGDGSMATGILNINGDSYYFDQTTGIMKKTAGWIEHKGKKYFAMEGGDLYKNAFISFGVSNTYYMNSDGSMVRGWLSLNQGTYYFSDDGLMARGTTKIANKTYSFGQDGILRQGSWVKENGKTYYYDDKGQKVIDWYYINGKKYFFNDRGEMIGSGPVKKVIDVSSHNGSINWDKVKKDGDVDYVILRCGYGSLASQEDVYFSRNVKELQRLNIPFGIYLYSYAEDSEGAIAEANNVNSILKKYNLSKDIEIYYDLEHFTLGGNYVDVSKSQYEQIVKGFMKTIQGLGYKNSYIYSYTYYLNTALNSSSILPYVKWVAEYNYNCNYSGSSYWGWQYSSKETVPGIDGNVDMNVWFK